MKIKYPSINGLRAISITLVVIHHLCLQNRIFKIFADTAWLKPLLSFLQDGQLGVNVFFVISGFLITSLMQQEEIKTNTVSLKDFYIRRTLRIFPAYYTLLLVYFVLQLLGYIHIPKESWLTAATYTKYFNWKLDWYTRHAWSLSIEEHFYILWPLIFLAGNKVRKIISISLIIIVPFVRLYEFFHPTSWLNELTIFTRIDAISIGCLFALFKDEIVKKMSPHWNKIFYFSVICIFVLRYLPVLAHKVHLGFIFIPLGVTHGTIANILIAFIMMYSVFKQRGAWFKILNWKFINYIGLLSYSIYLWQQFFIYKSDYWINQFPQNVFCMMVVAICSYNFIEKPFLKLKSKFQGARKKQAPVPAYVANEI
ncbi:MAG: acyltransferase [Ferruginibacter sp.]